MKKINIVVNGNPVICSYDGISPPLISEMLGSNDIHIDMPCSGKKKCGKCLVKISEHASAPSEFDRETLSGEEISDGYRLACANTLSDGMVINTLSNIHTSKLVVNSGSDIVVINNPIYKNYGIALDIGTTTMVMKLFNKEKMLAFTTAKNPQRLFGADVISRIDAAINGKLGELHRLIIAEINTMIKVLSNDCSISQNEIDGAVFTGNTAMLYFLTNKTPQSIATAPFESDCLFGYTAVSDELGLCLAPNTEIYLPRCMEAFVGADITTAILATDMLLSERKSLILDIGTNGEIALYSDNQLINCSTAAGPAFEGAELFSGMSGTDGAIDKVYLHDNKVCFSVIGDISPLGICGSGVIDLLSVLLDISAMDESGYLDEDVLKSYGILDTSDSSNSVTLGGIIFSQADVRKVQLAKASIAAGVLTLLSVSKIEVSEIEDFFIAGGFGSFINLNSAVNIGLIPSALISCAKVVGNAALDGAVKILCNNGIYDSIGEKIAAAQNINLSSSKIFMDNYIDCMEFSKI